MVVQHNMQAMNASRMLGVTTGSQSKATEKLSSGYRINRAADDAAGLSISEKMRKQIRGLDRASTNAQDGISAVQTAEGALTEVHSMLQRMNELAVQSANGTNAETDRKAIQDEIDQLVTEIDRVAETTKFNETYLLKGDAAAGSTQKKVETVVSDAKFELTDKAEFKEEYKFKDTSAKTYYAVSADGKTKITLDKDVTAEDAMKCIDAEGNAKDGYTIYKVDAGTDEWGAQLPDQLATAEEIKAEMAFESSGLMDKDGKEVTLNDVKNYFDTKTGAYKGGLYSAVSADDAGGTGTKKGERVEIGKDKLDEFVTVTPPESDSKTYDIPNALQLKLHVGADSADTNKISISIDSMSAAGIGVKGLNVSTEASATSAIDTIKDAIQKVSSQRSALGAVQNRLEHTIANLDNVVENTTSAESRIRDTDMAEMMVEYSKNNILAQAGQSMLAQANQSTQGVLSLLQ